MDPESLRKRGAPIPIAGNVDQMVGSDADLWLLDQRAGTVTRVDTISRKVGSPTRVGLTPQDMAVGLGAVWVADHDGSLYRVDAVTLEVRGVPDRRRGARRRRGRGAEAVWVYVGDPVDLAAAG